MFIFTIFTVYILFKNVTRHLQSENSSLAIKTATDIDTIFVHA